MEEWSNSLTQFGTDLFPHHLEDQTPDFHYEIDALLQDQSCQYRCIIAPRGHAKSMKGNIIYNLWRILIKPPRLTRFIVLASETKEKQAVPFLATIKDELEYNELILALWGNLKGPVWTQDEIVTTNRCKVVAVGSGQRIRGMTFLGKRPTDFTLDDIESPENNCLTKEGREKLKGWVMGAVFPSMDPRAFVNVLGTIAHQDAYLPTLVENPAFRTLQYTAAPPQRVHQADADEAITLKGPALWPARYPMATLNAILANYRSSGKAHIFYQEYMNDPRNPEEQTFRPEDLRYYNGELKVLGGESVLELEHEDGSTEIRPVTITVGVDLAISTLGDYNVLLPLALDVDGNYFVGDYIRVRAEPYEIIEHLFRLKLRYAPRLFVIESVAYQAALASFTRKAMRERNIFLPLREVKPRDRKNTRLSSLEPLVRTHRLHVKRRHTELETEMFDYPKAKHDDIMDSIWSAVQFAIKPVGRGSRMAGSKRHRDETAALKRHWTML